ncbi:ABC transporter ATP-binding protein [Paenibacillus albicereus]|uniref:ABC transporter ATP-binding protein n=1 Tax=Paenibacillus albicereus TaxID=2726185 RepID=A0A6H2GRZ7_9BACL|nr:ABC transporter ATP-binding protein [Paenibacillus albicereus]QJC50201.1 ABC transporter ATP-binding protein [Paenibacillus albicereus]
MIEARAVSKSYAGKKVIDAVSTRIQPGSITSFIGPNGAGKSTLLSMMTRLMAVDEGEVLVEGKPVSAWDSKELAKKLSILKQANHINVRLTVRELVSFGRFPYSQGRLRKEDWARVDEAIAYMELGPMQHKYLDELSGGQKQRAFIAMVVAQDTEYIFLDEPLNNLDMKHAVGIMRVLRRLVDERGKTVVLVIHDVNFASFHSDRIVALKDGRVIAEGATDEILTQEVLLELYGMDVPIEIVDGKRVCVYFG